MIEASILLTLIMTMIITLHAIFRHRNQWRTCNCANLL